MRIVADLHIHSKYSRAVSPRMTPENLDAWADDKGITVMGTGDFTHPLWIKELKQKLEPAEPGLFRVKKAYKVKTLKGTVPDTRFMLTVEISCIYSRGGKTRRVHNIVLAPDFETVEKINAALGRIGNLRADGRPILGLDSEELLKIVLGANPSTSSGNIRAALIPAHAWTPWFSVFGSMSGFNTLEECFGDYSRHIFAIETGLSSDPAMNARLSMLDNVALISNSDSHSLERIGREANVFECELSYASIMEAIKSGAPSVIASEAKQSHNNVMDSKSSPRGLPRARSGAALAMTVDKGRGRSPKFLETIEFFPEEGKYHYDGHRLCNIAWTPEETKKHNSICSVCGGKVTVGVSNRIDAIADRPVGYKDAYRVPFRNLIGLDGIIGEALDVGVKSKAVQKEYVKLIQAFGSELNVLMNVKANDLARATSPAIAEGIARMRAGRVSIKPGYDGEYGVIKIFSDKERAKFEA